MNDSEVDQLLGTSQPAPVPADALTGARQDLLREIMSAPVPAEPAAELDLSVDVTAPGSPAPSARRRPGWWLFGLAAAVVGLALALPMTFLTGDDLVNPASDLPQQSLRFSTNPYLLLENPQWYVASVRQTGQSGAQTFARSLGTRVEVAWDRKNPDDTYRGVASEELRLFGHEGLLYDHGGQEFEFLVTVEDGRFLRIHGEGLNGQQEFLAFLADLYPVGEQEWLDALPEDMVAPSQAPEVAQQMLDDLPSKGLIDTRTFETQQSQTYAELAADVVGPRMCTLFNRYQRALEEGDEKQVADAVQVLEGSRDWPVLREVAKTKTWPDKMWRYSDRAAQGENLRGAMDDICWPTQR